MRMKRKWSGTNTIEFHILLKKSYNHTEKEHTHTKEGIKYNTIQVGG